MSTTATPEEMARRAAQMQNAVNKMGLGPTPVLLYDTDEAVERLAAALLRAVPGYQRWLQWPATTSKELAAQADAAESEAYNHAAAIIAALRTPLDSEVDPRGRPAP